MAKHDIVTYNSTTKGFETDLGDNNAEIKGTGDKIFSVESGSTEIFSVGIDNTSITLNSNLTASGDISSSLASTASFSRLEFTKISGDASQMTNVNEIGHVSGAAQVASRISGAFDAGFVIQGDLSGSATSTGSFAKVFANTYVGDASQMTNVNEAGHFSASAQMASDISGSHTSGFEYTGIISGSATSTGSFGRVDFTGTNISGDASQMTSVPVTTDTVSGSAQLAADISGSFNKGFLLDGTISGSMTSTASFHTVNATSYVVTNEPDINTPLQQLTTIISSSAQISTAISESFNKGFEFTGTISSSATTTGSFSRLDAIKLAGDGSQITDLPLTGIISSSAQLATQISGSFNKGFEFTGTISGSVTSTGSFGRVDATTFVGDFSGVSANEDGHFSSSMQVGGGTFLDDEPSLLSANRISRSFSNNIYFGGGSIVSSYFVGVSGSQFMTASNATTMSIMSLCGSDYDYRLFDNGDRCTGYNRIGQDTRLSHTTSAWKHVAPLVGGGRSSHMTVGTSDAALAMGGYNPALTDTTEKYNGATWAASATLGVARSGGAAGTQNAALIFGGKDPSSNATDTVERYNGSTWSEVSDLPSLSAAGYTGGFGTQNDAYAVLENSEAADGQNFNGTSWSETAANNTFRQQFGIDGSHNSAIMVGAYPSPTWYCAETWDGTSWTTVTQLPNGARQPTISGTANAAHAQGNHAQLNGGRTYYQWNGSSWDSSPVLNCKRGYSSDSGAGISSNNLFIGGTRNDNPSGAILDNTEHFQIEYQNTGSFHAVFANKGYQPQYSKSIDVSGVTYDFGGNFPTALALSDMASDISGSFNKGFKFTGTISGSDTSTGSLSKFKADVVVTHDMTIGSFTDTNLMPYQSSSFRSNTNKPHIIPYVSNAYYDSRQYVPTGSGHLYSCGSCTEFSNGYNTADGQLSIGRDGILNISFQSSSLSDTGLGKTAGAWSAGPDMITGTRGNFFGQQNASVMVSGGTTQGEPSTTSHTQHYNGVSWRRGPDILEAKGAVGGGQGYGHGEDDIGMGRSYTTSPKNSHLQYNGHSWWYMTTNLTTGRNQGAAGTQNAAVIYGGSDSPNTKTEEWNGHTWDVGGDMVTGKSSRVGAGSQNAAIAGGGTTPSSVWTITELYNGTTWSSGPNTTYLGHSTGAGMGGTQNNALGRGGGPSPYTDHDRAATWDGVAWAAVVNTPEDRHQADVSGNGALGMVAGGGPNPGSSIATTLEWNNSFNTGSFLVTKKIGSNFS